MAWVKAVIQKLMREKFWGRVTIHFKDGKIVQVDKLETMKPE